VELPDFPVRADFLARTTARFAEAYRAGYGYSQPNGVVEAVDWYLLASIADPAAARPRGCAPAPAGGRVRRGTRKAFLPERGGFADFAVVERGALVPGERIEGPAILEEAGSTTLLLPNSEAVVGAHGHLIISCGA